mmetsp:Transcript_32250/g.91454  ORF Transcript_32250/g.91454 Transcript_32250/m.91454 type:complete len:179 (-) Transcript_32250:72-608(-)
MVPISSTSWWPSSTCLPEWRRPENEMRVRGWLTKQQYRLNSDQQQPLPSICSFVALATPLPIPLPRPSPLPHLPPPLPFLLTLSLSPCLFNAVPPPNHAQKSEPCRSCSAEPAACGHPGSTDPAFTVAGSAALPVQSSSSGTNAPPTAAANGESDDDSDDDPAAASANDCAYRALFLC